MSQGGEASNGASPYESKGVIKGISKMVELVCGFHHKSSKVAKLKVRLHQGCGDSDQQVS